MGRFILFWALGSLYACGGATASDSSGLDASADPNKVCAPLADSGFTFARCIAASCCDQLAACAQDGDGIPYEDCILNCTFDGGVSSPGGGGSCTDSCKAAHPQGAAVCRPYLDCATAACAPGRR